MKFEYEKVDVKFVERKIREEEKRVGKNVTKVVLSAPEWAELLTNQKYFIQYPPQPYQIVIYPQLPITWGPSDRYEDFNVRTVTVTGPN